MSNQPDGKPTGTVWRVVDPLRTTTVVVPDPSLKRLVGFGVSRNGEPFQVVWVDSKKEGAK